jgi:hypothetical protein
MQAPLLFGVDPDETWRYVPAVVAAAGAKVPAFILKAPRMALAAKRREIEQKRFFEIDRLDPGVAADIIAMEEAFLAGKLSEEGQQEYVATGVRWDKAYKAATATIKEDMETSDLAILCECIAGWEGLTSAIGAPLDFDKLKSRLPEVIRDESLRAELVRAACAGATLSKDDAEGLPS